MTDSHSGSFRLREDRNGVTIGTVDINNGDFDDWPNFTDFTDNNNTWTSGEHGTDRYALDVHWAVEHFSDYFAQAQYNRDGLDDNGLDYRSLIHYGTNLTNAAFDASIGVAGFGDGSGAIGPYVALDIVAHEFAHGITYFENSLNYEKESGAIDEGISDIYGAIISYNVDSSLDEWLIGEEMCTPIRSMSNPNTYGQPDTYEGTNWYDYSSCTPNEFNDYCGVHTNSGVMNYWFYLLVEGGSGTNDNSDSYDVEALGWNHPELIMYQTITQYMTSTTDYEDMRDATIMAAEDLFCENSIDVASVTNAWHAVGVGSAYSGSIFEISGDLTLCTSNKTYSISNLPSGASVSWSVSPAWMFDNDSGSGTSFTTKADNSSIQGQGTILATVTGTSCERTVGYNVWLGPPSASLTLENENGSYLDPFPCIDPSDLGNEHSMGISQADYNTISGYPTSLDWDGWASSWSTIDSDKGVRFYPNADGPPAYASGYFTLDACNECGCDEVASAGYAKCSYLYSFSVYPNPSSESITVEKSNNNSSLKILQNESFSIEIIDNNMNILLEKNSTSSKSDILVSKFQPGIYYLRITDKDYEHTQRIVIK